MRINILTNITLTKPKGQYIKLWLMCSLLLLLSTLYYIPYTNTVQAIYDPTSVPNNRFGIHIISPTSTEASHAADLVNSNGDWGYVTVLIESKDRNEGKWQSFFDELRRRHLIPLVRLATQPEGGYWKKPYDGEETAWADFLNKLNWPTKNRYIIVYNEPNHGTEWGNVTDPKSYAQVLDKTITALKNRSDDFFVMNAGFDASTPNKPPVYFDQLEYMKQMELAVPGIFNRLDGWSSHSYPNPGFVGAPNDTGRKSIRGWFWELQTLRDLGVTKVLPVFITETGWKHSEGKNTNKSFPSVERVADFYAQAFADAWNNSRIVAVTPFLLNYQDVPFDHFSFKKLTGEKQDTKILGVDYPDPDSVGAEFYPQFYTLKNMPKSNGQPIQEIKAELQEGGFYPSTVVDEEYELKFTFKNIGQSIWNDDPNMQVKLVPELGRGELALETQTIPLSKKIEPGSSYTFTLKTRASEAGTYFASLDLFAGDKKINHDSYQFKTDVKSPVILKVKAGLTWKNDPGGDFKLDIAGIIKSTITNLLIGSDGLSSEIESKYLLPDSEYEFKLSKPYYIPKSIKTSVHSGVNELDFGSLQPDIPSAILNPPKLWSLLPFSN